MKIEFRSDKIIVTGYVNAVGRDSRPFFIPGIGKCVEQVEPGVFGDALKRATNVDLLINHDSERKIGSTSEGNVTLTEDNIGLKIYAEITDATAIEKARHGEFRGWSYGMFVNNDDIEERADNIPRRHIRNIDIFEVSMIDKNKRPCYDGTSIEFRANEDNLCEIRGQDEDIEIIDFSGHKKIISELSLAPYERRISEL